MAAINGAQPTVANSREETGPISPALQPSVRKEATRWAGAAIAALLQRVLGPPPYRASIGRIAAAVTVPVFCWVFFTTSSGMIDIMRRESNDWIGTIGAVIGTTAVLVMLAATSISLGADIGALIARRQFVGERIVMKTVVTTGVFIFVFSISAFFSFTYYYTNIFKLSSKKIVGEMQPMELTADVILPALKTINANYDSETARIIASPGMQTYLNSLDALLQVANDKGPRFREGVQKIQDEMQANAAASAAKAAAALQEAQAARRLAEEARNKIVTLGQTIADFESTIKAKEDEIAALTSTARQEDQLALDASKGLDNLGASCGPNCESHRTNAVNARRRIAAIRQTLVAPLDGRSSAMKQRGALSAQLVALQQRAENASASRVAAPPTEEAVYDFDATLRKLAELRNQIRSNPNWEKIREMKGFCNQILVAARRTNISPAGAAADFACEPMSTEARDLLTARDEVIAGRVAFDQNCALDGAIRNAIQKIALRIRNASNDDKSAASNGFNEAKQIVDGCIVMGKSAGLSEADMQTLLKRSDAFSRSRTMDRNRFELAREAFLSFTPDATMAISVAVAQDAFMFVMKVLSEIFQREVRTRERPPLPPPMDVVDDETDDPDVRVMKALLRVSRPLDGDMSAFDAAAPSIMNLPENIRDNLVGLLNRLVRDRIAYINRHGAYILDNRTLSGVEARLAAALEVARAQRGQMALFESEGAGGHNASGGRRRLRGALQRYVTARFPQSLTEASARDGGGMANTFDVEAAKDGSRA